METERETAQRLRLEALDECGEMLHHLNLLQQERAERELYNPPPEWSPPPPPAPPAQHRRSATQDRMDDARIKALIEAHVAAAIRLRSGAALEELATSLGGELGSQLNKLAQAQKDRADRFEARIEARLREVEQRLFSLALMLPGQAAAPVADAPAKPVPRLIGVSDAAD